MSIAELKGKNVNARMWIQPHEVESSALDQIRNVCALPDVVGVAIMPDVHTGMGATIGSVIVTKDTISPALTGVDIGCGMEAVRTSLEGRRLKERVIKRIHDEIRERIPVGFTMHNSVSKKVKTLELWESFDSLARPVHEHKSRAEHQLGTLGGGNHFIELSVDKDDRVWVMLHSGSRHIGLQIANTHIAIAKNLEHNKTGLPDKALAYFIKGTPEFANYIRDLQWAQEYARLNRNRMLDLVLGYLEHKYPSLETSDHISCHHNYVEHVTDWGEDYGYVTRKGAISARKDQMGIIPGAMGAKSYIVRGLGCMEAYHSAPHGAGRKMSRSKAKKKYRLQDLKETMKGIVCEVDKHTVDEIQYSYKKIDKVMEYSTELVTPVYELNQIMNIKG
jgi:tRNA-splicing ligase RtcB